MKLTDDDYEDEAATNRNYPETLHGETSISSAWIWYIPAKEALGVGDKLKGSFGLKITVIPRYASWYHWRATIEYDSNKQIYNKPGDTRVIPLPAPDRDLWGIISVQCKKPGHNVSDITIYKQEEYKEDGSGTPIYNDNNTRCYEGESVEISVPEGNYVVTYYDYENDGWGWIGKQTVSVKAGTTPFNATSVVIIQ